MYQILRNQIINQYKAPINSAKDCNNLVQVIAKETDRQISSSTLRRFFGLLPSKSSLSKYNLDTLAIYCGNTDFDTFYRSNMDVGLESEYIDNTTFKEFDSITQFTINSIAKKSFSNFKNTIPRQKINTLINTFIKSDASIYPLIAPCGYGKSIALAHWVKKFNSAQETCLFCPAPLFFQVLSPKNVFKLASPKIAGASSTSIEKFIKQIENTDKKLIIILDALEELSYDSDDIHELSEYLINLLNNSDKLTVKLIISSREVTWKKSIAPHFEKSKLKIFSNSIKHNFDTGYCNIPLLSNNEIRLILERTTQTEPSTIVYNFIPWIIREMIRIPINLYLFISLYEKFSGLDSITQNTLHLEYLKQIIFKSKWAEQKEDLIWFVIDKIEKPGSDLSVNKNELKNLYPIHLKRETKYYSAYKELLFDGIFLEERIENQYGVFLTTIKFKNQNFYYYLTSLNLIRKNGKIDFNLFLWVSQADQNPDWIVFVTATLFEMAYINEDFDALERFCELPEFILSSHLVRFSVGNSFRINNEIRNSLIEKYATSPHGQVYFFEQFVDTNYLYNNYEFRIKEYLKNKQTIEAQLFGNCILFLSSFLKMNVANCNKYIAIIDETKPDSSIHPWPIGRKVTSKILYSYFIDNEKLSDLREFIETHRSIAYKYKNYLNFGLIEYELPLILALALVNEFKVLHDVLLDTMKAYNFDNSLDDFSKSLSNNQNLLPHLFLEYSKFKLNISSTIDLPFELDKALNNYANTFDDLHYQIMLNWFLCDYYSQNNSIAKATKHWLLAMELSKFAEYDFYVAFLQINHPEKNNIEIEKGTLMFKQMKFSSPFLN